MIKNLLYTLIAFCSVFSASAQRKTDLRLKMVYPRDSDTIRTKETKTFTAIVYNNGPATVTTSDTIAFYILYGNDTSFFIENGNIVKYAKYQRALAPGDSFVIIRTTAFDNSFAGMELDFCMYVKPINYSNPINDTFQQNNKNCADILIEKNTSIRNASASGMITVAPNPVSSVAFIHTQETVLSATVTDLQGRTVEMNCGNAGELDCSMLPVGMYVLSVTTERGTFRLQFHVAR